MKVLLLWLAAALIIIVMTRVSNLCGSVIHANSRKQSEVYQKEEEEEEDDDDDDDEAPTRQTVPVSGAPTTPPISTGVSMLCEPIDPALTASHGNDSTSIERLPASVKARCEEFEVAQLRQENAELRRLLDEKTDEVKKKSIEIASLRSQAEYISMMSMGDGSRPR